MAEMDRQTDKSIRKSAVIKKKGYAIKPCKITKLSSEKVTYLTDKSPDFNIKSLKEEDEPKKDGKRY